MAERRQGRRLLRGERHDGQPLVAAGHLRGVARGHPGDQSHIVHYEAGGARRWAASSSTPCRRARTARCPSRRFEAAIRLVRLVRRSRGDLPGEHPQPLRGVVVRPTTWPRSRTSRHGTACPFTSTVRGSTTRRIATGRPITDWTRPRQLRCRCACRRDCRAGGLASSPARASGGARAGVRGACSAAGCGRWGHRGQRRRALTEMVDRLARTMPTARILADGLARLPGIHLDRATVQTKHRDLRAFAQGLDPRAFIEGLKREGVLVVDMGGGRAARGHPLRHHGRRLPPRLDVCVRVLHACGAEQVAHHRVSWTRSTAAASVPRRRSPPCSGRPSRLAASLVGLPSAPGPGLRAGWESASGGGSTGATARPTVALGPAPPHGG